MRRYAAAVAAGLALAVAAGTPAAAHGGDEPGPTDYRVTVTSVPPELPGVRLRPIRGGTELELAYDGPGTIEVLGYSGEPYLEVRPGGVYQNTAGDPAAPPRWRRTATERVARWHDERTQWNAAAPTGAARQRLREWTLPLRAGTTIHQARGTLDWLPPPQPGGWWAAVLLLAAAVTAAAHLAGRRRGAVIPPLAAVAGAATLGYAVARTRDAGGSALSLLGLELWPALSALAALALAGWILVRRSVHDFTVALTGACLALFGGLSASAAFGASVLPAGGPATLWRTTVVVTLGVGAGLSAAAIVQLRRAVTPAG